jgi:2-phospho-L-lactate guanylyltransferase
VTTETRWSVVVPLKPLESAKTRLRGVPPGVRQALVVAMASDVRDAVLACEEVRQVVVVTRDSRWRYVLARPGVRFAADSPEDSLNDALRRAAAVCWDALPDHGVAALTADLPALTLGELRSALRQASCSAASFVADAQGEGTTLFATQPSFPFDSHYGPQSRRRHREAGAMEIRGLPGAGIRQDVDTVEDLQAVQLLGVGRHTAAALRAVPTRLRSSRAAAGHARDVGPEDQSRRRSAWAL